jgi:CRISPR type III-B/RAMP module RAMP protein Cmr6
VSLTVAGPLGRVIESDGTVIKPRTGYQLKADANALIMLNRVALLDNGRLADKASPLLRWAAEMRLGQQPELIRNLAARRARALDALRASGRAVVRLRAEPEWRMAVGLGSKVGAHEIGLSLHGTYGWPVIPASSLKGMASAWAVASGAASEEQVREVLGAPQPPGRLQKAPAKQGSVCFLDAIPGAGRVTVTVDVLTPHVKPYYDTTMSGSRAAPVPPAEYHNPVPVNFLTVSGTFAVDLYGQNGDLVNLAAEWLTTAAQEQGAGAKTAAGYGYLTVTRLHDRQDRR